MCKIWKSIAKDLAGLERGKSFWADPIEVAVAVAVPHQRNLIHETSNGWKSEWYQNFDVKCCNMLQLNQTSFIHTSQRLWGECCLLTQSLGQSFEACSVGWTFPGAAFWAFWEGGCGCGCLNMRLRWRAKYPVLDAHLDQSSSDHSPLLRLQDMSCKLG